MKSTDQLYREAIEAEQLLMDTLSYNRESLRDCNKIADAHYEMRSAIIKLGKVATKLLEKRTVEAGR